MSPCHNEGEKNPHPKDSAEFSSSEVLDFHYAIGKVMHTRHGWQSLETILGELGAHKFIGGVLFVECIQLVPTKVARVITLADNPKPEMFSENPKLNLVERIGRYCFVN